MNLLEKLFGQPAQITEQPITYNLEPLQPNPNLGTNGLPIQQPSLKPIMINQNGGLMPQVDTNKFLKNENNVDAQQIATGLTTVPEKNGIMQDLAAGFRDNLYNPISVNNFRPDANKSIANKLGEGFGTATRLINSPAGRMALTAGIVGASGGTPLQALSYGATAGVGNQRLKTQDTMYRKALEDNGIDTSNISGYIDGDMYRNYTLGNYRYGQLALGNKRLSHSDYNTALKGLQKQLSENILSPKEYTKQLSILNKRFEDDNIQSAIEAGKVGESNQTTNTKINKDLAPARKKYYEAMPVIAGMNAGTNAGRLGLAQSEFSYKQQQDAHKNDKGIQSLARYSANLNELEKLSNQIQHPNNLIEQAGMNASLLSKPHRTTPQIAAFEAQKKHVAMTGMKAIEDVTGRPSVFTMEQLLKTLPNWDDTPEVIKQKMATFKDQVNTASDINYGAPMTQNNDPLGIR